MRKEEGSHVPYAKTGRFKPSDFDDCQQYLAITVTQSEPSLYAVAVWPYALSLTLMTLILGVMLITVGMAALWDMPLALILLIPGAVFLAASIAARRHMSASQMLEVSTILALYVAVEFLAGAVLAYIGIFNLVFPSTGSEWSFVLVSAFGLLLAADSLFFYLRDIKHLARRMKGVQTHP